MKALRQLATELVALQMKARASGLFAGDRELPACTECGLPEDVVIGGRLITYHLGSNEADTGLRFHERTGDTFRCPACGATVREELPA